MNKDGRCKLFRVLFDHGYNMKIIDREKNLFEITEGSLKTDLAKMISLLPSKEDNKRVREFIKKDLPEPEFNIDLIVAKERYAKMIIDLLKINDKLTKENKYFKEKLFEFVDIVPPPL